MGEHCRLRVERMVLAMALALSGGQVLAVDLFEQFKLVETNPAASDELGFAVAAANGEALVAARSDGVGSTSPGWVRAFVRQGGGWSLGAALAAADGGSTKRFGESLSLAGDYVLVGAPRNSDAGMYSGSAYVFYRGAGGWSQQAKLVSSDAAAYDEFGVAVALDGVYALVGARSDDDGGSQSGSVYVYQRSGASWTQKYKMVATDDASKDKFGSSVDVEGDYALIGAPGDDNSAGSAYVFLRSAVPWAQQAKLTAADRADGDLFGTSVSLAGALAAVGAPGDDNGAGAVYVYQRTGTSWAQISKLVLSGKLGGDAFGHSVVLFGDRLLVGAPGRANGAGRAYLYALDAGSWITLATYRASDGQSGARLGQSAAADEARVVIGAPGIAGGAAYVFSNIALDCNANGIPDVCDTSCTATNPVTGLNCQTVPGCGQQADCNLNTIPDGCEPDCNSNGVADECDTAFGTSPDCNTNSVPDECEADCNTNGRPDDCDLADGMDSDCNANGVPDGCELYDDAVLLAEDFEAGTPPDWTATGLWHTTDQCTVAPTCDGVRWAYFGLDAQCNFNTGAVTAGVLSAPPVHIPESATSAVLRYCSVYDGDRGSAPDGFDAAWVEINGTMVDDVSGTYLIDDWETRTIDLGDYVGQDVAIQWRFDSNDAISNRDLGWQIDQVRVVVDSDCNANGVPDGCDITSGASADCNTNGVPDECDLAQGSATDCNANGVIDACEPEADCNANGVLDMCEVQIRYVRTGAVGAGDGGSWADAYPTLRGALTDTATECLPVELWVAAGTYTPAAAGGDRAASFHLRNDLALYGGFSGNEVARDERNPNPAANLTVLSGDLDGGGPAGNSYHVVSAVSVNATAVLDGFTITGGVADNVDPHDRGAALYLVSAGPTIRNCMVAGNTATIGALMGKTSSPLIEDCTFWANTAPYGGAMYWATSSAPVLRRCRILGNVSAGAASFGGGLYVSSNSAPRLYNCAISGNSAGQYGGGVFAQSGSKPHLVHCTISRNTAGEAGGGVYAGLNCVVRAVNSIFWANSDVGGIDESAQITLATASLTLRYSCVAGFSSLGGVANSAADPLLVDADGPDNLPGTLDDDLHLTLGSPCIDAGSNGASTETKDLDGWPRRVDEILAFDTGAGVAPFVDRGAHEVQSDCNENGVADPYDISAGTSGDCNANDKPDECEIDVASTAPGGPFFCTANCAADCNSNGVPDACDIAGELSADCTLNGVPDECEGDCDNDGIADSCAIAAGGRDCDANGVPDDCELAANDCDANGVLDRCSLANPYVVAESPQYSPVETGLAYTYVVPAPPPSVTPVVFRFRAKGDLNTLDEFIVVGLNGVVIGEIYKTGILDCNPLPASTTLTLTDAEYNSLLGGGDAVITLTPSDYINGGPGCPSFIQVTMSYQAYTDCNRNGLPDGCEDDCNTNGVADACEVVAGSADDCDENGLPDVCDLAAGGDVDGNGILDACEADCDNNGVPDECDVSCVAIVRASGMVCGDVYAAACGLAADCDANGTPDGCDVDCNANNLVDACELSAGSAEDCNANAVPDVCEIPTTTPGGTYYCTANCADDCNLNGVPDECEIDAATPGGDYYCVSECDPDCNLNGVPDACDIGGGEGDCDGGGVPDECEADRDGDGLIDACDGCPDDMDKTAPGVCGCGVADRDDDGDGVPTCIDACPETPSGQAVDAAGCPFYGACCQVGPFCEIQSPAVCLAFNGDYQGNGSTCLTDRDEDGVANCFDECPDDADKIELGLCGCGRADDDGDSDGVPDCYDLCPATSVGETVDADGCPLHGACCLSTGGCSSNPIFTEAYCTNLGHIYQGNGSTCALGCAPRQLGDYDADGDVDLDDFAKFSACVSGPMDGLGFVEPTALCGLVFDADYDGDVDLRDYVAIQQALAP